MGEPLPVLAAKQAYEDYAKRHPTALPVPWEALTPQGQTIWVAAVSRTNAEWAYLAGKAADPEEKTWDPEADTAVRAKASQAVQPPRSQTIRGLGPLKPQEE